MESSKSHIGSILAGGGRSVPIGAIWANGRNFKTVVRSFLSRRGISVTDSELQDLLISSYDRMMVKVTSQREKYIAVANRSGKKNTHPSWFLHIYQEHTGSVICAPFGHSSVREKDTEIPEPVF